MTLEHFKSIILTFIAAFALMAAGRLVNLVTSSHQSIYASPFYTLLSGAGVWLFIFLGLGVGHGVPLPILWWGFFAVTVLSFLTVLRTGRSGGVYEHYQSQVVMGIIALLPALIFVAVDVPLLPEEFALQMPLGQALFLGDFSPFVGHSLGAWPIFATVSFAGLEWVESSPAVFYLLLFSLASTAMLRILEVKIRWSNLPLVVGGALLSLSVINPLLDYDLAVSSLPDFMLSFLLLAGFSPLLVREKLALGLRSMPHALILSLLVCVHGLGLFWFYIIVLLTFARLFFVEKAWHSYGVFSASLLVCLPLLSFYLWGMEAYLPLPWDMHFQAYSFDLADLEKQAWFAACSLFLCVVSLFFLFYEKDKQARWVEEHSLFVAVVAFFVTCVLFFYGFDAQFSHIQFLMILPLWRFYMSWYSHSNLKNIAFKRPWFFGFVLIVVLWAAQSFYKSHLAQVYSPPFEHTMQVAEVLREDGGFAAARIAVLDVRAPSVVAPLFDYTLQQTSGVFKKSKNLPLHAVDKTAVYFASDGDLDLYLKQLRLEGFTHLWIHTPTDLMRLKISPQLRSDHSYLFEIKAAKLSLVKGAIYPHLDYVDMHE